jgi:hypothetical protein
MQIQFNNALFDSALFAFAVVTGSRLTIVLENAEIDLDFDSEAEALVAQAELGELLDSVGSVSGVITEAAAAVTGLLSGLFGAAKAKVVKTSTAKSAEDVATTLTEILEQALGARTQAPRQPGRSTAAESNDVFGTSRTARGDAADAVVSDLSDAALRTAIEDKAAYLVENDARVSNMVAQLRRFHTDAQVNELIEHRKEQVFQYARQNGNLTLNQIVAQILR